MKSKNKIILCITLIICYVGSMRAQQMPLAKGYYMTKDRDSIVGYFDLSDNNVRFNKTETPVGMIKLKPSDVLKAECDNGDNPLQIATFSVVFQKDTEDIFIISIINQDVRLFRGYAKLTGELFFISTVDKTEIRRINKQDPKSFLFTYFDKCNKLGYQEVAYNASSLLLGINRLKSCKYGDAKMKLMTTKGQVNFSLGLTAGGFWDEPTVTGWYKGAYNSSFIIDKGVVLKLNLGKRFSIGTGLSYYHRHLISTDVITSTGYIESNKSGELQYLISYKAPIEIQYNVIKIPFEISWKLYRASKRFIPVISAGATLLIFNNMTATKDFTNDYTYETRSTGSKPITSLSLLPRKSAALSSGDYNRFIPFISLSVVHAVNKRSSFRVGAKAASNHNIINNRIDYDNQKIIFTSDLKSLQFGLFGEYLITF